MAKLEKIKLDLKTYKVLLKFHGNIESLSIHFDTPSRRFYFALIALIVTEMKNLNKPELAPLAGSSESIVDLFMKGIIK